MRLVFGALALLALVACKDETLTGYGAGGKTWVLETLDDAPFPAKAVIAFPEAGRITGQAPCNGFEGTQTAPYPWFGTGPLIVTEMACPDLEAETRFFQTLQAMTLSEVAGDTMILRNDAGREMVFRAAP